MIIVDAHEDLAWNIHTFSRDYTRSIGDARINEEGSLTPVRNGDTLLGWPEYQLGHVAVVFATLFAAPIRSQVGKWDSQCYPDFNQARRLYSAQLDTYHKLVNDYPSKFRLIHTKSDLKTVLAQWERNEEDADTTNEPPIALVVLMEGAECVRDPIELEEWWQRGVRLVGPSWAGTRFCGGTREPGPMTTDGFALLESMADMGFGLDLSHMDEVAVMQALDTYPGQIMASHSNALSLMKGSDSNRHLSDRVIRGILERDGVIGIVPFNTFLCPGWKVGDSRDLVPLQKVVDHIDYVCQMAGDAFHAGIGSDFDGGFGVQSVPVEIDTIADLQKIVPLLDKKGYTVEDIAAILAENWLRKLGKILPESI